MSDTQARGYNTTIVVDQEATYGVAPTEAAGKFVPVLSESIVATKEHLTDERLGNGSLHPRKRHDDGFQTVTGDIEIPVDILNIAFWLGVAFGPATATVYKAGSVARPSFLLERKIVSTATKYWLYNGCKVAKISFKFGGRGELTTTISLIGQKETVGTSPYMATPGAMQTFTRMKKSQCVLTAGGSAFALATEFTLDIDFGLDQEAGAVINGPNYLSALPDGIYTITGSLKSLADTANPIHDLILSGAESALTATITSGGASLAFSLAEVEYDKGTIVTPGPKGLYIEGKFHAFYDNNADTTALKVTHVTGA